jgi:hypothetical protein
MEFWGYLPLRFEIVASSRRKVFLNEIDDEIIVPEAHGVMILTEILLQVHML